MCLRVDEYEPVAEEASPAIDEHYDEGASSPWSPPAEPSLGEIFDNPVLDEDPATLSLPDLRSGVDSILRGFFGIGLEVPRIKRVKLSSVKPGQPFTYRGITYIKGAETASAFRLLKGTMRTLAPDFNVRVVKGFTYGDATGPAIRSNR